MVEGTEIHHRGLNVLINKQKTNREIKEKVIYGRK